MSGRWRRWGVPIALLVGCLGTGGTALGLELTRPAPGDDHGGLRLATPVVSARRVPTLVAAPVAARRLARDLDAWVGRQPPATCVVVTGDDGDLRVEHRAEVALVPASGAKLLTATAALEVLGGAHRFRTVAAATAPPVGGVVPGDLVLVGGGDPLLASPDYAARFRRQPQVFTNLEQLATSVAATGITHVEGAVVGDEGRYDTQRYVPSWPQRYIDQDQVGPLSALSVNDGFVGYPRAPDDPQELEPAADPAREAAAVLTRLLEAHGVDVAGEPRAGALPEGAVEVAVIESPPLRDVAAQLLRESDNSTGELLLKELGRTAGDPSTAGGRAVATEALSRAGVDVTALVVADGSGLSLDNRVSCDVLAGVVDEELPPAVLRDGLPVAGRTGTLAERFGGTPLEGTLRAKTGSLNSVSSLTGVVEDGDGPLTFSMITNVDGVITPELLAAQRELGELLLSWPRVPDVTVLGPQMPPGSSLLPGA